MDNTVFALATLALGGLYIPRGDGPQPTWPGCTAPPAVCRSQTKLDKGALLVASRDLRDPNFSEAVVLLVAHGPHGTMGVIVNRPSDTRLATVLPDLEGLRRRPDVVYLGGPVITNLVLLLIRSPRAPQDALAVFDNVYASGSLTALKEVLRRRDASKLFRAFAGHAGWAPGQLEGEVARGDWYVTPAEADMVLTATPEKLWERLIQRVEGDWVRRQTPALYGDAAASVVKFL